LEGKKIGQCGLGGGFTFNHTGEKIPTFLKTSENFWAFNKNDFNKAKSSIKSLTHEFFRSFQHIEKQNVGMRKVQMVDYALRLIHPTFLRLTYPLQT